MKQSLKSMQRSRVGNLDAGKIIGAVVLVVIFSAVVGLVIDQVFLARDNPNATGAEVALLGVVGIIFIAGFVIALHRSFTGR